MHVMIIYTLGGDIYDITLDIGTYMSYGSYLCGKQGDWCLLQSKEELRVVFGIVKTRQEQGQKAAFLFNISLWFHDDLLTLDSYRRMQGSGYISTFRFEIWKKPDSAGWTVTFSLVWWTQLVCCSLQSLVFMPGPSTWFSESRLTVCPQVMLLCSAVQACVV